TRLQISDQITDKTLICPHCLASVDNPQSRFQIQAPDINTDVKRDLNAGSIILAVLIVFSVLGIVLTIIGPLGWASVRLLMYLLGALFVFVIVAIVRGLARRHRAGVHVSKFQSALGCFFLVLGTIVALVIFAFFACTIALSNMPLGR